MQEFLELITKQNYNKLCLNVRYKKIWIKQYKEFNWLKRRCRCCRCSELRFNSEMQTLGKKNQHLFQCHETEMFYLYVSNICQFYY